MVNYLKLSDAEKLHVEQDTKLIRCNDLVGRRFIQALEAELTQARNERKPFDLVIINPFGVFLGADTKDVDACTRFLNEWLNPLLSEFGIGAILIHHTPKTNLRDTSEWKPSDWNYSGAGAAVVTNWARAYLAIDPCDTYGVFRFVAAKRGMRIGWGNEVPVIETLWAHSQTPGQLLWVPANADQIASAKPAGKKSPDDLLTLIPAIGPVSEARLIETAKEKLNIGRDKVRDFISLLIEDGKISEQPIKRDRKKAAIGYVKNPTREKSS